ncbi:MAG: hypothetical protein ACOC33_00990 [bacterium]
MEVFDVLFNKASIYDMLFFNIKHVSKYPTYMELMEKEPELAKQWDFIAKTKYSVSDIEGIPEVMNDCYQNKSVFYPEFCKIVAITYATIENDNGGLKRNLKRIAFHDEFNVINIFNNVLLKISSDGMQSTPKYFPVLCGHNIINNDIPLYLKRLLSHRNDFKSGDNIIPYILKNYLKSKPWDANILDTINVWKFNGMSNTPLSVISEHMGLKKTVELDEMIDLSKNYWQLFNNEDNTEDTNTSDKALEYVSLQSATQTNLSVQLINDLRIR